MVYFTDNHQSIHSPVRSSPPNTNMGMLRNQCEAEQLPNLLCKPWRKRPMGVRGSDLKNLKKKRGGWVKFYSCMNVWQNFLGPSNSWNSSICSCFVLNSLRSTSLKLLNLRFSHYWYIPTRVRTAKVFLSICLDLHLLRQLQFGPPFAACGKKCSRADRTFNMRFRWPNRFSYPDMGFLCLDWNWIPGVRISGSVMVWNKQFCGCALWKIDFYVGDIS